jgi:hypothetical protein
VQWNSPSTRNLETKSSQLLKRGRAAEDIYSCAKQFPLSLSLSLSLCVCQTHKHIHRNSPFSHQKDTASVRSKRMNPCWSLSFLILLLAEEATGASIEKKLSELKEKHEEKFARCLTGSPSATPETSDKKRVRKETWRIYVWVFGFLCCAAP